MSSTNDPRTVVADPQWLPVHWKVGHEAVQFAWVPRASHAELTFLDDEYLTQLEPEVVTIPLADLDCTSAPDIPAPHYIFHSAFCCSTLLARAFDAPGVAIGLKEPQILNELAEAARAGSQSVNALDVVVNLLARPFAAGEGVVIKPSNVVNRLAAPLLERDGSSRAIFLYAPLPRFLGSVAAKGMWGRIWARRLFALLRRDTGLDFGLADAELFALTDLQVAALAWLMHQAQGAALIGRFGTRVRTLDSETFLVRRADALLALGRHFALPFDRALADAIAGGPVFRAHSKEIGRQFDPEGSLEPRAPMAIVDEEAAMVATWARTVAEQVGVPLEFPPDAALLTAS